MAKVDRIISSFRLLPLQNREKHGRNYAPSAPYSHPGGAPQLLPIKSIAVEDTPAGILSAKGAGLRVLAVTNSYGPEELSEADWIIDSLKNVRVEG